MKKMAYLQWVLYLIGSIIIAMAAYVGYLKEKGNEETIRKRDEEIKNLTDENLKYTNGGDSIPKIFHGELIFIF